MDMHTRLTFDDLLREERRLREYNQCHTPGGPGGGQFCGSSSGAGASASSRGKGRTTANDLLNQTVNYGGVPTRRGDVMADLQRMGLDQKSVDSYMTGLDRSQRTRGGSSSNGRSGAFKVKDATTGTRVQGVFGKGTISSARPYKRLGLTMVSVKHDSPDNLGNPQERAHAVSDLRKG